MLLLFLEYLLCYDLISDLFYNDTSAHYITNFLIFQFNKALGYRISWAVDFQNDLGVKLMTSGETGAISDPAPMKVVAN
jgi:hypothetical protein